MMAWNLKHSSYCGCQKYVKSAEKFKFISYIIFPQEPAKVLREAIQTGDTNLRSRMTIQLDNDIRYGQVRFDHWLLHAKVTDLPTIIESMKTIDGKNFYKTADICQIVRKFK